MIFITYLSMSGWAILFYLFALPFSVLMLVFFSYITLRMIKRWNHTIQTLEISGDTIAIVTFGTIGLKSIKIVLHVSKIKVKNSLFLWYSKEKREGIMMANKEEDFYLVKDYFKEYDEIIKILLPL